MPDELYIRQGTKEKGRLAAPLCFLLSSFWLRGFVQRRQLTRLGEAPESVLLDLANPLGADAEAAAGLAERSGLLAAEAEAQPDNVTLALGQAHDGLLDRGRAGVLDDLVLDQRLLCRDQLAEGRLAVLADGLIEARQRAGRLADLDHLVDRELNRVSDLLLGRLATEPRGQLALRAVDLALALRDVDGQADRAGAVLQPALDRLTDPQRRVRRELEPLAPVELLGRANQAEHALLDEVAQREAVALVLPGHRHHQAQVRVDHPVLRGHVALLDPLGELDLLDSGEQRVLASGVEEQLEGVGSEVLRHGMGSHGRLGLGELRPGLGVLGDALLRGGRRRLGCALLRRSLSLLGATLAARRRRHRRATLGLLRIRMRGSRGRSG